MYLSISIQIIIGIHLIKRVANSDHRNVVTDYFSIIQDLYLRYVMNLGIRFNITQINSQFYCDLDLLKFLINNYNNLIILFSEWIYMQLLTVSVRIFFKLKFKCQKNQDKYITRFIYLFMSFINCSCMCKLCTILVVK